MEGSSYRLTSRLRNLTVGNLSKMKWLKKKKWTTFCLLKYSILNTLEYFFV